MYSIEESTCDIVGTFRRPAQSSGDRGVVPLLPPLLGPCMLANNLPVSDKKALSMSIFFGHRLNFFKRPKKFSQFFGHNVLKSRPVNIVTASFNTIT